MRPTPNLRSGRRCERRAAGFITGCNVENLSFGLTICAERAAVFTAVAMGEKEFEAIAVVADSKTPVTPCGACRQVLAEFAADLPICSANLEGERFESTLRELLPRAKEGILGGLNCSTWNFPHV